MMRAATASTERDELQQRLLAGPTAKLTEKTKYLPTALVAERPPAGCDAIARLPELHEFAEAQGEFNIDA